MSDLDKLYIRLQDTSESLCSAYTEIKNVMDIIQNLNEDKDRPSRQINKPNSKAKSQ